MMQLYQIAEPDQELIALQEAKDYLRVVDDDSNPQISGLITAARQLLDGPNGILGRCLARSTWRLDLHSFPRGPIRLPLPPFLSIEHMNYLDSAGDLRSLSINQYRIARMIGGQTALTPVGDWPGTVSQSDAVQTTYRAGYTATTLPAPLKLAMLILVGHWYETRGTLVAYGGEPPWAVDGLIAPYKIPAMSHD